ncbi:hypothetical protein JYU34_010685 [Plutella xylostella]|uniref:Uncharacterized protein n=1 Tax=Plutella xylostella TaxID=51655 RepID=A0ABQ7QF30_PLUXY|nr:hypothetical protein JYU34_010685 [Plutella xylostella]
MELSDPYELQRRQYEYYEQLRRSDPAAYMQVTMTLWSGGCQCHRPVEYGS